jgi:uncharacterized protein YbjT (DUF2867 family)
MKFTLTGSLGNITKPLAGILIGAGHQVTIISSSADRAAAIEAMGATATTGSVEDVVFLTKAFTGADVVYTMVPPHYGAGDVKQHITNIGKNYAAAIQAAGVKRVVNLSSIGAHLTEGAGPIVGLHRGEQTLNALEDVSVKHLRPAYFYINLFSNIDLIKQAGIIGSNCNEETSFVLVHPKDIAAVAAEEIQQPFTGKSVRYIASDERRAGEIATVLGAAIGKPDLKWVAFSDEDALNGMMQAGMPEDMAKNYIEMGGAARSGKLWEDYQTHKPATLGKIKLEDFAVEFAAKFNN